MQPPPPELAPAALATAAGSAVDEQQMRLLAALQDGSHPLAQLAQLGQCTPAGPDQAWAEQPQVLQQIAARAAGNVSGHADDRHGAGEPAGKVAAGTKRTLGLETAAAGSSRAAKRAKVPPVAAAMPMGPSLQALAAAAQLPKRAAAAASEEAPAQQHHQQPPAQAPAAMEPGDLPEQPGTSACPVVAAPPALVLLSTSPWPEMLDSWEPEAAARLAAAQEGADLGPLRPDETAAAVHAGGHDGIEQEDGGVLDSQEEAEQPSQLPLAQRLAQRMQQQRGGSGSPGAGWDPGGLTGQQPSRQTARAGSAQSGAAEHCSLSQEPLAQRAMARKEGLQQHAQPEPGAAARLAGGEEEPALALSQLPLACRAGGRRSGSFPASAQVLSGVPSAAHPAHSGRRQTAEPNEALEDVPLSKRAKLGAAQAPADAPDQALPARSEPRGAAARQAAAAGQPQQQTQPGSWALLDDLGGWDEFTADEFAANGASPPAKPSGLSTPFRAPESAAALSKLHVRAHPAAWLDTPASAARPAAGGQSEAAQQGVQQTGPEEGSSGLLWRRPLARRNMLAIPDSATPGALHCSQQSSPHVMLLGVCCVWTRAHIVHGLPEMLIGARVSCSSQAPEQGRAGAQPQPAARRRRQRAEALEQGLSGHRCPAAIGSSPAAAAAASAAWRAGACSARTQHWCPAETVRPALACCPSIRHTRNNLGGQSMCSSFLKLPIQWGRDWPAWHACATAALPRDA